MEALCGLKSYIRTTAYTSTAKVAHDFKLGCAAELARFAGLAILRLHSARSENKVMRACLDVDSDNNHVPVLSFISPDAAFMSLECYRQRTHKMSDPIPASSPGGSQFCHGEGVETLQIKGNRIEGATFQNRSRPQCSLIGQACLRRNVAFLACVKRIALPEQSNRERFFNPTLRPVTEAGDLRVPHQVPEAGAAHMYQRRVVAALEIDVTGIAEAFVEDHRHVVGRSDRWDSANVAVGEERANLIFRGEAEAPVHDNLQRAELDPVRAGNDGQDVAHLVMHDDGFRQPAARNMGGLRRLAGCRCAMMRDGIIGDTLTVDIILKFPCDRHRGHPLY